MSVPTIGLVATLGAPGQAGWLALIGVTIGLLLTRQPFGFMALLGFLSLSGMLIKNAIVLVDEINLQRKEDKRYLVRQSVTVEIEGLGATSVHFA